VKRIDDRNLKFHLYRMESFQVNCAFRHVEINDVVVSLRDTWYKKMSSVSRERVRS